MKSANKIRHFGPSWIVSVSIEFLVQGNTYDSEKMKIYIH